MLFTTLKVALQERIKYRDKTQRKYTTIKNTAIKMHQNVLKIELQEFFTVFPADRIDCPQDLPSSLHKARPSHTDELPLKLTRLEDHCQTVYCSPPRGLLCLSDPWTASSLQGTHGTQMHRTSTSADIPGLWCWQWCASQGQLDLRRRPRLVLYFRLFETGGGSDIKKIHKNVSPNF